ncbi:MAG: DUF1015 domain-containing protein [Elusimicrobia bacterium]|nr:DUF1015 domain-containing protein [Elusimicrobiota bacterium]
MINRILPFKGIRYNPDKVDISSCVAPPYDVFNYGDETDRKLRSSRFNIVHIQKPEGDGDLKYENAARIYREFLEERILITEEDCGAYVLCQSWGGNSRTGILACVGLDDSYTSIRRHEKTKAAPIEDRLKLTMSTGLNIGSIFAVFGDAQGIITGSMKKTMTPSNLLYEFTFPEGIINRLYFVKDPEFLGMIGETVLYIADGHHRYHTMLEYRKFMRKNAGMYSPEDSYESTMMFLVPDTEILILPYHRYLKNMQDSKVENMLDNVSVDFKVMKSGDARVPLPGEITIFHNPNFYTLGIPAGTGVIDVEFLHRNILEPYLGLTEEKIKSCDMLRYIPGDRDIPELARRSVEDGCQAAFFLSPVSFSQIKETADRDETMPRKSTFFFPKVPTGIVLNSLI